MCIQVGRDFVYLVFFKALPGKALSVLSDLAERCRSRGLIPGTDYRALRLIGSNDLLYLERGDSMTHCRVSELGVLPSVIGSSEHVCYCNQDSGLPPLAEVGPLVGLSFVKLNQNYIVKEGLPGTYLAMSAIRTKCQCAHMGSIGWADFVSLIHGADLSQVLDDLFSLVKDGKQQIHCDKRLYDVPEVVVKTVSFLAYDPTWLPSADTPLADSDFMCDIGLACPPFAMTELAASLVELFGDGVSMSLGARDLVSRIRLSSSKGLGESLAKYEAYLDEHAGQLFDSRLRILRAPPVGERSKKPFRWGQNLLELRADEATEICLTGSEGRALVRALYLYNNMLGDPLLYAVLSDLMRFALRLRQLGMMLIGSRPQRLSMRRAMATTLHYMQQAIAQRTQGAFGALEEKASDVSFGSVAVGYPIQKVIKGLEYIPRSCLSGMQKEWSGFVLVGRQRSPIMEHFLDIILMPFHDALSATRHWAILHEVMHVYQHMSSDAVDAKANSFWDEGMGHICRPEADLVSEAYADVMTYFLTCPLELEEYFPIVWRYLISELYEEETGQWQIHSYLLRNMSVMMVRDYLAGKIDMQSAKSDAALTSVFNDLCGILSSVDVRLAQAIENRDLRAEVMEGARVFICPRLAFISSWIKERGLLRAEEDDLSRAREAVLMLQDGQVLGGDVMRRPELIAWFLAREKEDVDVTLAWVLSLYSAYVREYEPTDQFVMSSESDH